METNNNLTDIDQIMDEKFGKVGTLEREAFRRDAYAFYMGQIISDARKKEHIMQSELAKESKS